MTQIQRPPEDTMRNAAGYYVPLASIHERRLLEDQLVRGIIAQAEPVRNAVADFMARARADIVAFRELLAEAYGVKRGGTEGNTAFTTFDGQYKAEIVVSKTIVYGPEIRAAKDLIDECLIDWAGTARMEIQAIVNSAFRAEKGRELSRERLAPLRELKFDDLRWQRAMAAIADSERVAASKAYVRLSRRRADGGWENMPLVER